MKLTLFPNPTTELQEQLELAYQLGVSEGKSVGRIEGIETAQARMREAQEIVQCAMGIREEGLGQ